MSMTNAQRTCWDLQTWAYRSSLYNGILFPTQSALRARTLLLHFNNRSRAGKEHHWNNQQPLSQYVKSTHNKRHFFPPNLSSKVHFPPVVVLDKRDLINNLKYVKSFLHFLLPVLHQPLFIMQSTDRLHTEMHLHRDASTARTHTRTDKHTHSCI